MATYGGESSGGPRQVGRPRILIAEDEVLVALELEALLGELDWDVVDVVSHVESILPALGNADCALLDINLKGQTSYDAARYLRARHVPFAFVTGYTDLPECPPELTGVPRLGKPFSKPLLDKLLAGLMAQRQQFAC